MLNGSINNLKFVEFYPFVSIRDIGNRCQFVQVNDQDWVTIAVIDTPPNVLERFVLFSSDFKHMAIHYNFKPYEGGVANEDGVVPVVYIYRLDKDDMGCKTTPILELNLDTPRSLFPDFYQLSSDLVVDDDQISFVYTSRISGGVSGSKNRIKVTYTRIGDVEWRHSSSTLYRDPISNDHQHLPPQVNHEPMRDTIFNSFRVAEAHDTVIVRDLGSRCQFYKETGGRWTMVGEIEIPPNVAERIVLISKDGKYVAIQSNIKPQGIPVSVKDQWIPRVDVYELYESPTFYFVKKLTELTLDKPRSLPDDFYQLYGNLTVEGEEISFVYERTWFFEDLVHRKVKCTFTQVSDTEWLFSSSQVYQPKQPEPIHQPKETTMDQATKDKIRHIFLNKGFTIKEGQPDLKPYVYEAAEALLKEFQVKSPTPTTQEMFQEVDHLTPEENALLLDAQTKAQQYQKKVEYYTSLASHLLNKPGQ